MTKVELIRSIGDVLRQLDHLKADQPSGGLGGPVLTELRNTLAKQQLMLAITALDESTPAFLKAGQDILACTISLHGAIGSADNGVVLSDNIQRLINAVGVLIDAQP